MTPLPIDDVLSELMAALQSRGRAVLQAPPGAGKTTRVPLAMLEAGLTPGTILILEPRRLAARAAAHRMAEMLGEKVGQTVGYRMRGQARVSAATRIEVVTEGILTRRLQSDPGLEGVGAVIFDEFHERSLNGDLGLALCLEVREALREDLIVLVMSATLDAAPVADLIGAPVITSQGQSFPVETRWLSRPPPKGQRFEAQLASLVQSALEETRGSILVFLPGEGEIRRLETLLRPTLPSGVLLLPLFGAMDIAAQQAAIRPTDGRKIVLATAIAETSLTIEGVTCVVDGGRARRARFDPGSGMSRLVTERVTRAEATQRQGRAGRMAPGICFRNWTRGEEGGLAAFPPAEIEAADLSALALELALWGAAPADLAFLTPPPEGPFARARALLQWLGALDKNERITDHGRKLAALPLHPRLAHMLVLGGAGAAPLAALLSDRDPMRSAGTDLAKRLSAVTAKGRTQGDGADGAALARIRTEATRLAKMAGPDRGLEPAALAALAFPDRIGAQRKPGSNAYLLSGGKGAQLGRSPRRGAPAAPPDAATEHAAPPFLVATDLDGDPRVATIRQAITLPEPLLRESLGGDITWHEICAWSERSQRVETLREERLGAITLRRETWAAAPPRAVAQALLDGIRAHGLSFPPAAENLCARIEMLRRGGADLPDFSRPALMESLQNWLLPYLDGLRTLSDIKGLDILPALTARLDWPMQQLIERLAPAHFTTPTGRRIAIDYSADTPAISLRLQEMFGVTEHPTIGADRQPLKITLLSPAGRPLQTTMDLPGFWASSYTDVRKDMRGRYPKHPWPEDPAQAAPTRRAKPRP